VHRGGGGKGRCHQRGRVVNTRSFFGEALGQALDLGLGSPDDVLRHVNPDMLAQYLPRPLWARLLTACLGAPRVDAQLVVETIGVPNLCEHLPGPVIWQVIAEIAARVLGQPYVAPAPGLSIVTRSAAPIAPAPASKSSPIEARSVLAPPPEAIEAPAGSSSSSSALAAVGPSIPAPVNGPLADLITELEADERPITPTRARTPTSQRFRQSNTGIGRLGASAAPPPAQPQARRPQAAVPMPVTAAPKAARRGATEVEDETDLHSAELRGSQREIAVDDSQLVDWQSTETTQASGDEDFSDIGRKRDR